MSFPTTVEVGGTRNSFGLFLCVFFFLQQDKRRTKFFRCFKILFHCNNKNKRWKKIKKCWPFDFFLGVLEYEVNFFLSFFIVAKSLIIFLDVNVGFVTPWMLGKGVIYIMLETKVQREL